jgi:long-subunit fatty acid transport protein
MDLISRDYSKSKIRPNRDFLNTNSEISTKLTNTLDIRVGTEIRLNEFSLRGGYTKIESPYKNLQMMGNSNSYSFGLGYDFGASILSVSHKVLKSEKNHQLFDSGLTDLAKIDTNHSVSNLSLIFKF